MKPGKQMATGTPTPVVQIGGYSIIEAPNTDAAVQILRSHPYVGRGGTLQLHEVMAV